MENIRIGTLVNAANAVDHIPTLVNLGFESLSITFWESTGDINLVELAKKARAMTDPADVKISSLSVFGNPLTGEGNSADTYQSWIRAIDNAPLFGADMVTGFTGRMPGSIPESIPAFKKVFGELVRRAEDNGVKIAFENCYMGGNWASGDWNIAVNPKAWELMFDAVPNDNIGLEWEPCHQMVQFIDPIPQLRKWAKKIFHVHGKDATIAWDVLKENGNGSPEEWCWHRTPGFGDSNWTDIITILRQNGYTGCIDIEGWHDPVYVGDLEMTGQVQALKYLKACRGGDFIQNP